MYHTLDFEQIEFIAIRSHFTLTITFYTPCEIRNIYFVVEFTFYLNLSELLHTLKFINCSYFITIYRKTIELQRIVLNLLLFYNMSHKSLTITKIQ